MLINSVLSSVPCVKVRKGMIVVVTKRDGHGFSINSICKVVETGITINDTNYVDLACNAYNYTQCLSANQFRLADTTEKRTFRKQLKRK